MAWAIHQAGDRAGPALVAKSTLHGKSGYLKFMTAVTAQTTHVGRFFAFVCSAAWVLGYIGLNITANSISAANDICSLFPRYVQLFMSNFLTKIDPSATWFRHRWITASLSTSFVPSTAINIAPPQIFRGQMIAVTVGVFGFAPWKVMASASSIVNFATSYSVVLAPIASVMAADYFFVKDQKYDVPALYDAHGRYYYRWGTNWRAVVALICAIVPNIPGMGHALNSKFEIGNAEYIYASGVCYGIIVGAFVHVVLSKIFPDHNSLISEAVYAHEALAERAARAGQGRRGSSQAEDDTSEKEKGDETSTYVVPV
ncbi:hypothetical protein P7C70_g3729, partial [Phenoliferia sp. Uapishka_3]